METTAPPPPLGTVVDVVDDRKTIRPVCEVSDSIRRAFRSATALERGAVTKGTRPSKFDGAAAPGTRGIVAVEVGMEEAAAGMTRIGRLVPEEEEEAEGFCGCCW